VPITPLQNKRHSHQGDEDSHRRGNVKTVLPGTAQGRPAAMVPLPLKPAWRRLAAYFTALVRAAPMFGTLVGG